MVTESNCLGVSIDCKLTWKTQVVNAASNMDKKVKQLKRFRSLQQDIFLKGSISKVSYQLAPTERTYVCMYVFQSGTIRISFQIYVFRFK